MSFLGFCTFATKFANFLGFMGFTFNIRTILSLAKSPVTLPDELIGEVLSLLTMKSLMRMKCVNKSWNTLISDPIFVKMHLKLSPRNTHLILRSVWSSKSILASILPFSVSRLLKSRSNSITLTDDPNRRFDSKDLRCIIGSCNGLICLLGNHFALDYEEHYLYFWNPATRTKSEKLGSIRSCKSLIQVKLVKFTFGYDNSTDTYKVVLLNLDREGELVRTAVKVFTLGENVWRDIDRFPVVLVFYHGCLVETNGVYLSNSINWLVRHEYNCDLKNLTIKEFVIVSLDLGTETYSQLLLPRCCKEKLLVRSTLFVLMDCLCFCYDFEKTHFVIWQMKEFGVEESWTELFKISYLNLKIDYEIRKSDNQLIPLFFSEDDDAFIFATNFGDEAILYDWRNNRVKRIKSSNKVLWYNAKVHYVESLVSTC